MIRMLSRRLADVVERRRDDPMSADMIDWEMQHANAHGTVWLAAVMNGRDWAVYPPGYVDLTGNDPIGKVTPLWVRFNQVRGRRRPRLRRVRRWLVPWVQDLARGAVVQECVEGWQWYGPEYDQARYVVYLRLEHPRGDLRTPAAETLG